MIRLGMGLIPLYHKIVGLGPTGSRGVNGPELAGSTLLGRTGLNCGPLGSTTKVGPQPAGPTKNYAPGLNRDRSVLHDPRDRNWPVQDFRLSCRSRF